MENTISDFELDLIETLQNSRDLSEFQIERRQLCEREDVVIIVPGSMLVTEDVLCHVPLLFILLFLRSSAKSAHCLY